MESVKLDDYKGYSITLTQYGLFSVSGPQLDDTFSTYEDVLKEIDKITNVKERMKKTPFNLTALDENGKPIIITGIHMNKGKIISSAGNDTSDYIFPNNLWVQIKLERRKQLRDELSLINREIQEFSISTTRSYSRISAEKYDAYLDTLRTQYNKLFELAQQKEPKEEV